FAEQNLQLLVEFFLERAHRLTKGAREVAFAVVQSAKEAKVFHYSRESLFLDQQINREKRLVVGRLASQTPCPGLPFFSGHQLSKKRKRLILARFRSHIDGPLAALGKRLYIEGVEDPISYPLGKSFN